MVRATKAIRGVLFLLFIMGFLTVLFTMYSVNNWSAVGVTVHRRQQELTFVPEFRKADPPSAKPFEQTVAFVWEREDESGSDENAAGAGDVNVIADQQQDSPTPHLHTPPTTVLSVNGDQDYPFPHLHTPSPSAADIVVGLKTAPPETYLADNASFFIPRKTLVNQFAVRWLIQTTCPPEGPVLLVIVPSVHSHTAHRTAIRETWGSPAYGHPWPGDSRSLNGSVKFVFFVGVSRTYNHDKLVSEAAAFNDIVVGDFLDSYQNLSLKMAMVLQWADLHCARAKYLLKVDEDTFVNVPLLLDVLSLVSQNNSHFVLGYPKETASKYVARKGIYEVSVESYPLQHWPIYVQGHSYVISGDAISSLRHVSQHMPLITNEDAYVTGVLAKCLGLKRLVCFQMAKRIKNFRFDPCSLVETNKISMTEYSTRDHYATWDAFQTGAC
ncbi:beta-1,3-galactosyltransferase 1-like [Babylonia areolata]|uniref:beta-1,3-galactosyltransferase 1-like n=1 Tax=Babylonia areolata TaxID=304850 RepID=UPI003FCF450F